MASSAPGKVEIEGLGDLRRALKGLEDGVADLKAINLQAAQIVADQAESLVPVGSGALRDSIRAAGQAGAGVVRAGKTSVPYAGVIHFGWPGHNIEPQPFLYDALDERRRQVLDVYDKALDGIISKHFGRGSSRTSSSPTSAASAASSESLTYTTKAGVTRSASAAQIANWTRGS